MVDASNLAEGLQALPLPLLVASATGVVLLALIALRVLGNTFHGKAPPVEEGLPFIGGLIKFSKVRAGCQVIFRAARSRLLSSTDQRRQAAAGGGTSGRTSCGGAAATSSLRARSVVIGMPPTAGHLTAGSTSYASSCEHAL